MNIHSQLKLSRNAMMFLVTSQEKWKIVPPVYDLQLERWHFSDEFYSNVTSFI